MPMIGGSVPGGVLLSVPVSGAAIANAASPGVHLQELTISPNVVSSGSGSVVVPPGILTQKLCGGFWTVATAVVVDTASDSFQSPDRA